MNNHIEELIIEQKTIYVKITLEKNMEDIIYQNYKYYEKRKNKSDTVWSCTIKTCCGSLRINNLDGVVITNRCNPHRHEPYSHAELRLLFVKDKIFKDTVTSRKLTNQAIAETSFCLDDNERLKLDVPQIKRTIAYRLSKSLNYTFSETYDIPEELKKTYSGYSFINYIYFYDETDRMIVF